MLSPPRWLAIAQFIQPVSMGNWGGQGKDHSSLPGWEPRRTVHSHFLGPLGKTVTGGMDTHESYPRSMKRGYSASQTMLGPLFR